MCVSIKLPLHRQEMIDFRINYAAELGALLDKNISLFHFYLKRAPSSAAEFVLKSIISCRCRGNLIDMHTLFRGAIKIF